jgi:hypothetical protein
MRLSAVSTALNLACGKDARINLYQFNDLAWFALIGIDQIVIPHTCARCT